MEELDLVDVEVQNRGHLVCPGLIIFGNLMCFIFSDKGRETRFGGGGRG